MPDLLVRVLSASRFSGVEGGGNGSQPWRVWWNGRLDSWHSSKEEAEKRFKEIGVTNRYGRGWA